MLLHTRYEAWIDLCERIGWQGPGLTVYDYIMFAYGTPKRYYHTIDHIEFCLGEFSEVRRLGLAEDPEALEMAVWLHDIVCFLTEQDEVESMQFANLLLRQGSVDKRRRDNVAHCILATQHTGVALPTIDEALMVDIDLAGLGQSPEVFDRQGALVRKEYQSLPHDLYRAGRSTILGKFLQRDPLYRTQYFRDKYERQARENLSRSIAMITS